MSNTVVQILRSYANTAPPRLPDGELAYSYVSNNMFIGDKYGNIIKIGGESFVNTVDSATPEDTANTLVLRDENGVANLILTLVDGGRF